MNPQIDWNKDDKARARLSVSDEVMTHYVSADQLPEEFTLEDVARAFTIGYDHGGLREGYSVCEITDLEDEETHSFAFDGRGNFEWNTNR